MVMRGHYPESAELPSGQANAQVRNVALQKSFDERIPPCAAIRFARRQKRFRESSPPPQPLRIFPSHFFQREARQLVEPDTARQRFGTLPQQIPRCGAQNQEAGRKRFSIRQYSQQREQLRGSLDFIDNHQAHEAGQRLSRLGKRCGAIGIFQIEPMGFPLPGFPQHSRQGRLAALP